MNFVFWLVNLVASILGCVLLLRAYLWSLAISPRDPTVRFAWKLTDWLVNPISYVIRPRGNWEWASLVSALLVAVVATLLSREATGFPATGLAFAIAPIALVLRYGFDDVGIDFLLRDEFSCQSVFSVLCPAFDTDGAVLAAFSSVYPEHRAD